MAKLNILHDFEGIGVDDAVAIHRDIEHGYTFVVPDMQCSYNEYKDFIDAVKKKYYESKVYDYSSDNNNVFLKLYHPDFRIYFRGNAGTMFGAAYCRTEEMNYEIWKLFNEYNTEDMKVNIYAHTYYINGNSLDEAIQTMETKNFDVLNSSYYPYIQTETMFDQFFTSKENILLVVGKPGIGKSKLATMALKYAYENIDKIPYDKIKENNNIEQQFIDIAFVKSNDVLALDQFWHILTRKKHDFIIIDDLDFMLTKRDSEVLSYDDQKKNDFLNHFLSYTDGIETNKTKFIITTNQDFSDIDTALLRKGRLFDILELRELHNDEALNVWKDSGLSKEEFEKEFNGDVLAANLGSEISKRLNTKIDTKTAYVLEEGISKIKNAGRNKKITL